LFEKGFITQNDIRRSEAAVANAALQNDAEQKRLAFVRDGVTPRLAAKRAAVESLRAQARLRREEFEGLQVRAGMKGVLQAVPVEIGTQISAGTRLARVADPSRLKAEVRVAETQAKDVQIGQAATVDTRNGVVAARVSRVDPAVLNGTVAVDLEITGDLPRGARPDLSVDGMIELERLTDVVFSGRPAFGTGQGTVGIFRLEADGIHAQRVPVKFGRSSVSSIEVVSGLNAGDRIILSDMSQWDSAERVRLK
jgi:HlyD family secretion protein